MMYSKTDVAWIITPAGGKMHRHSKVDNPNNIYGTVGLGAIVKDNAKVFGTVLGPAWVTNNAVVRGVVEGFSRVCDNATIREDAHLKGHAYVHGYAYVDSGILTKPLILLSHDYDMHYVAPGIIRIGCEAHDIPYWLHYWPKIVDTWDIKEEDVAIYRKMFDTLMGVQQFEVP